MTDLQYIKNPQSPAIKPVLSVLVPFYKDDPAPLLQALLAQSQGLAIEIWLYDDGTQDPAITARLTEIIHASSQEVTLVIAAQNQGRSAGRNQLQSQARAEWVLFLDADMRPVSPHFLTDYLDLINTDIADIIFGGFIVPQQAETVDQELHRAFSEVSDCLTLSERQAAGPQYVASSNLCVKTSVMMAEGFDPEFTGWGWEDSEWAARVSQKFTLLHAEIPALHLGLEDTDTLLRRFKDSAQNYVRFTTKHPDLAQTLALYNISKTLKSVPGQALMRPVLRQIVKFTHGPIKLRLMALKLWRASWYAEALS